MLCPQHDQNQYGIAQLALEPLCMNNLSWKVQVQDVAVHSLPCSNQDNQRKMSTLNNFFGNCCSLNNQFGSAAVPSTKGKNIPYVVLLCYLLKYHRIYRGARDTVTACCFWDKYLNSEVQRYGRIPIYAMGQIDKCRVRKRASCRSSHKTTIMAICVEVLTRGRRFISLEVGIQTGATMNRMLIERSTDGKRVLKNVKDFGTVF